MYERQTCLKRCSYLVMEFLGVESVQGMHAIERRGARDEPSRSHDTVRNHDRFSVICTERL